MRRCGTCVMCCEVLGIEEIAKPPREPCPHQRSGHKCCSIYRERPTSCREFECLWLSGKLPLEFKPDQCGVFLALMPLGDQVIVIVYEGIDGGLVRNAELLHDLRVEDIVVAVPLGAGVDEVAVHIPPHRVATDSQVRQVLSGLTFERRVHGEQ